MSTSKLSVAGETVRGLPFEPDPDRMPPGSAPSKPPGCDGYQIAAFGFDADTLERAIGRALFDGIIMVHGRLPGLFHVVTSESEHVATVDSCTGLAGHRGRTSAHRAFITVILAMSCARGP
jgi:hypothetical protein